MLNQLKQTESGAYRTDSGNRVNSLEALAEEASQGDDSALYDLCEKLAKSTLFRVRYMLGDETGVEEVSQGVLLRVCENIKNLHEPKAFKAWLGCIVVNETRWYLTQQGKTGTVVNINDYNDYSADTSEDETGASLCWNMEDKTVHETVMEMVSCLPIRQREAAMLHYYDELSVAEVSWAMGASQQNVTGYLASARQRLKSEFERQPKASGMGVMAAMHMGALMSDALHAESIHFAPAGAAWIQAALVQCREYIQTNPAELADAPATVYKNEKTAFRVRFGAAMSAVTVVFTTAALILGILLGGTPMPDKNALDSAPAISGKIDFTGGEYYRGTTRVNPKQATLLSEAANGELRVQEWWITEAGSDTALYEGEGDDTENALRLLKESGINGEYDLYYRIADKTGRTYRLKGNFYIDEVPQAG